VPREADDASLEAARVELETVLNQLTAEAEAAMVDGEKGGTGKR
jgi:hypothetical protein